ncbi:hypothetical protein TNCV_3392621 [Trichonephila clavipes]|nr:hypothetical protein TNCV_3392621 [Trichonephila clavipes]
MHPVITFGAPTPESSVFEGGVTGVRHYAAKLRKLLKFDFSFCTPPTKAPGNHFSHQKSFKEYSDQWSRSGFTFCVPTSASYSGATVREYYGRLALSGKVIRTPKIRNMHHPIASTTLPQAVRRVGLCSENMVLSLVASVIVRKLLNNQILNQPKH